MNSIQFSFEVRYLFKLLLLLSTWSGPIPIGHAHAFDHSSKVSDQRLIQHVFHDHRWGSSLDDDHNWHVHWVVRGASYSGLCAEATAAQLMCGASFSEIGGQFAQEQGAWASGVDHSVAISWQIGLVVPSDSCLTSCATISGANWLLGHSQHRVSIPTRAVVLRC
jgi:hypothetical protein